MLGGHFSITMLGRNSSLIRVEHPESVHTAVRPGKVFVRGLHTDTIFTIFMKTETNDEAEKRRRSHWDDFIFWFKLFGDLPLAKLPNHE